MVVAGAVVPPGNSAVGGSTPPAHSYWQDQVLTTCSMKGLLSWLLSGTLPQSPGMPTSPYGSFPENE